MTKIPWTFVSTHFFAELQKDTYYRDPQMYVPVGKKPVNKRSFRWHHMGI
jgi:hypothetical protein